MNIQTDHYSFALPADSTSDILAGIPDGDTRQRIQDTIDTTEEGEPVSLPLGLADTLLNALSEWERAREWSKQ